MVILPLLGQALLTAVGMAWQVLWSLVFSFLISGMIQLNAFTLMWSHCYSCSDFFVESFIVISPANGALNGKKNATSSSPPSLSKRTVRINPSSHAERISPKLAYPTSDVIPLFVAGK